jgi:hypothetical protein
VATVRDYVDILWTKQKDIALRLGSDLSTADMRTRVLNISVLALIAVVIKDLVDNGVTTNARLNSTLNTALAETWPEQADDPR